jgi:hypothetical protein
MTERRKDGKMETYKERGDKSRRWRMLGKPNIPKLSMSEKKAVWPAGVPRHYPNFSTTYCII